MQFLTEFWNFIDRRAIVRRVMTLGTFWLCVEYTYWAFRYAETSSRPGFDIAAILGAIGTPLSVLMGYLFAAYKDSRKGM